jgi:hypothetical protein
MHKTENNERSNARRLKGKWVDEEYYPTAPAEFKWFEMV